MEDRELVAAHEKGCELKPPYRQARTVTMRDAKLRQEALRQQELPALTLGGMVVKNVVDNEVVGTLLSGDGSCERDIEVRQQRAGVKYRKLKHIWNAKDLRTATKLKLFVRVKQSFVHGCISWRLTPTVIRKLRNIGALWCAPITGKTVQQETKSPLVDFAQWVAYWQNRKVGRVMRRSNCAT
jgi:hypothetical protein